MIANKFAENFANICRPRIKNNAEQFRDIKLFYERLDHYDVGNDSFDCIIDINRIQSIISNNLHEHKAAGFDGLSA